MKDSFSTYSSTEVVRAVSLEVASWTWAMKLLYSRAAQRGSRADSSARSCEGVGSSAALRWALLT